MKRKLMQHGASSLTIALPKHWIDELNLKKGAEVEVSLSGNKLVVSASKTPEIKSKKIDLTNVKYSISRRLNALYRSGYDEIEITFDKPEIIEDIHNTIEKEMLGFEIVNAGKNHCVIKDLSGLNYQDFETTLKRAFFLTLDVSRECFNAINLNDSAALRNLIFRDKSINKFTNFCERILVKFGHAEFEKTPHYFDMAKKIENIADEYQYIARKMLDNKLRLSPDTIKIFKSVNEQFEGFFKLFYDFDSAGFESLLKRVLDLKNEVNGFIASKHKDSLVIQHLSNIARMIEVGLGDHLAIRL